MNNPTPSSPEAQRAARQTAIEEAHEIRRQWNEREPQLYAAERKVEELTALLGEAEGAIRDLVSNAASVTATDKNTISVRKGYEQGGYLLHYIVSPQHITSARALLAKMEARK